MSTTHSSTKRRRAALLGSGVALSLLLAGYLLIPILQARWSAPLGPALELATNTPTTAPTAQSTGSTFIPVTPGKDTPLSPSSTPEGQPSSVEAATPTTEPLCGGPAVTFLLGIGVDTEDDSYTYGLGDAIRVARVDFLTPKVTVLSFPRDLWVEIPEISEHYGLTHGKLNQSYFYGTPGMAYYNGPGGGAGLMARTLALNFGLRVDHYGAVNMSTFVRIVDALGGIDIYLPYDVDGTPFFGGEDMGYFTAGQHHFSGEEALRFSRIRRRYNDFTRADHQTMVLCALKEKLLSPAVLPKIPQIFAAFKDSVITDLSLEQISQLACLLPHLQRENLIFTSFPEELFTPSWKKFPGGEQETFVMDADLEVLRAYVSRFIAGTWPDQPKEPSCP